MPSKSVLLIVPAVDFNEQEYLTVYGELIKNGFKIFIASDAHTICTGSNGLKVKNDVNFFNMREANFGAVVFIGGHGVRNYWDNQSLHVIAKKFLAAKKIVAAICSAPVIIARAGILDGINASCFPEDKREIERERGIYSDAPVTVAKKIITAQGPASAKEFVLRIINELNKV